MRAPEDQNECNIPKDVHFILPQLNFIYMMNCSLTHIPVDTFAGLESLEEIDLSNNLMKKLDPSLFVNNPKLSYANLQNNPLPVHDRPILISKSLRELDVSNCGIKEIPRNMFKNLIRLQRLRMNNNRIASIREGTLPNALQHLYMNNNKLTSVENGTLPNPLKVLKLSNNLLTRVPEAEFDRLKKIRKVDLSRNPINCTCDQMNFVRVIGGNRPVIFENDVQCFNPPQYRGRPINKIPEQFCLEQIGEGIDLPDDDSGDDDDYSDPRTNQVIAEKKHATKKDDVQKYLEADQVVLVEKKANADYNKEEMQSDSVSNEGSGDGGEEDSTDTPIPSNNNHQTSPEPKNTSANNENNETKPDPTLPDAKSKETWTKESVTEKESEAESHQPELPNTGEKGATDVTKGAELVTDIEIVTETTTTESAKVTTPQATNPEATPEIVQSASADSEPKKTDSESTTSTSPNIQETPKEEDNGTAQTIKTPDEHKVTSDAIAVSHAQLQNDNSNSDSSIFNLGYIIPCLAIVIVIVICLGIYLGQRSSHKNWEPNNTTTNNDGAELQDVSLLPEDKSKMPIVKNKKYPSEENSEQTERLMSDGDPSTPKSIWEHLEEPIENGNSKYATDTQLPNGQSIDKNEPIECAIAKVTTLPDSIPRTPQIRNARIVP